MPEQMVGPENPKAWALEYGERGIAVVTMPPGSKVPYKGSHGKNDATTDPRTIEAMYEKHPEAAVAIVPAHSPNHICVLDIENRHGGEWLLQQLAAEFGPDLLETPTVRKPSGPHLYFADSGVSVPSWVKIQASLGAEILGRGTYARDNLAIAPCSVHKLGYAYEWAPGLSPLDAPFKPFTASMAKSLAMLQKEIPQQFVPPVDLVSGDGASDTETDVTGWREYDHNPRVVKALCDFIGIQFAPGKAFRSPLRDAYDMYPSGCIYRRKDGRFVYKDFSNPNKEHYFSLCQVYGAWTTGKMWPIPMIDPVVGERDESLVQHRDYIYSAPSGVKTGPVAARTTLNRVEFALWQTRMLMDLSFLPDAPLLPKMIVPQGAPPSAHKAADGFHLLLRCYFHGPGGYSTPRPYTYGFAATWNGTNFDTARHGIDYLKESDLLVPIEKYKPNKGRPYNLYLPSHLVGAL